MNITQAANINCGKLIRYDKKALLTIRSSQQSFSISRAIRKQIWRNRIWNFNRDKLLTRSDSQPLPSFFFGNVRSLRNKLDETITVILDHQCDIVVLTESWLNEKCDDDFFQIPGYSSVRLDRNNSKKGGGGILSYVKSGIKYSRLTFNNPGNYEIDALVLNRSGHLIIAIYHPFWSETDKHDEVINTFHSIILCATKFSAFNMKISIVGDFNGLVQRMDNFAYLYSLKNIVHFPTRGKSILDCCFTNIDHSYYASQIAPISNSDHCMVKCIPTNLTKKPRTFSKYQIPDFSPVNKLKFVEMLDDSDFNIYQPINSGLDLNFQFDLLLSKLWSIFSICFPLRSVKLKKGSLPWINKTILLCMRKRDNFFRRKNFPRYKHYRRKVKDLILSSKITFMSKIKTLSGRENWRATKIMAGVNKGKLLVTLVLMSWLSNFLA